MPNIRGGKGYKKGKGDDETLYVEKKEGQLVGRILKPLGDLNMSVFCEDKITRICKVAVGIKKKVRFFTGDIVLLSLRDCFMSTADLNEGKHSDRGDILGKFHQDQYTELKKTVNALIFANVDTLTEFKQKLSEGNIEAANKLEEGADADEYFDYSKEEEEEKEDDEEGAHVTKPLGWKSERETKMRKEAEVTFDEL